MRLSNLQMIVESATGYVGGPAVDEMPHLGLDEAAGMLPVAIMESQMELSSVRSNNITSLTEAAGQAVMYGTQLDITSIVEGTWENVKAKVKAFFEKIKKFIASIIAKLRVQIDKIFKSGRALYEKYKDSQEYRGKDPKDLTVSGYEFEKWNQEPFANDASNYASKDAAEKLFQDVIGSSVTSIAAAKAKIGGSRGSDDDSVLNAEIEKINDISVSERQAKMAEKITGISVSDGSWASDVRKELWGEKKEIKYGEGTFTKSFIDTMLGKPDDLNKIISKYEKMQKAADAYEKAIQKEITEIEKTRDNDTRAANRAADAEKDTEKRTAARDAQDAKNRVTSDVTSYITAYMGLVHDSFGVVSTLQNIEWEYKKAKLAQAKVFFGKILSYNKKKDNNDAADSEEFELLITDL